MTSALVRRREAAAMVATARWMYASALQRTELDPAQQRRLVCGGLDQVWVRPEARAITEEQRARGLLGGYRAAVGWGPGQAPGAARDQSFRLLALGGPPRPPPQPHADDASSEPRPSP